MKHKLKIPKFKLDSGKRKVATIILGIFIIVILAAAGYFFWQYQKAQQLLKNPGLAGQIEVKDLMDKVGRLIYLPSGEQPTIATVSDYRKLQDQPFFQNAKNGFKVLIYTQARLAILYDPVTNRVVFEGPLNATQPTPTPQPVNIAIYNGTATAGLTSVISQELKTQMPFVNVVEKGNASGAYAKTEVIDLSGSNQTVTAQIAQYLGGQVITVPPTNEKLPKDADILILLGKNN